MNEMCLPVHNICTDMEAEEYEKIFTFINEGKKLFNSVVFQSWINL